MKNYILVYWILFCYCTSYGHETTDIGVSSLADRINIFLDKITEESIISKPLGREAHFELWNNRPVDKFLLGLSLIVPDTIKVSSFNLRKMSKMDAEIIRVWCLSNYDYLTWGFLDDAMNIASCLDDDSLIDINEIQRLKSRFNFRKTRNDKITNNKSSEYIADKIHRLGALFQSTSEGITQSVKLNLYICAFVYAISNYSGKMFFDEATQIITLQEFENLKDWCFFNADKVDLSKITELESKYICAKLLDL